MRVIKVMNIRGAPRQFYVYTQRQAVVFVVDDLFL